MLKLNNLFCAFFELIRFFSILFLLLIIVLELLLKLLLLPDISNFILGVLAKFILSLVSSDDIFFSFFSSGDLFTSILVFNKSFLNFFKFSFEKILFALLIDIYNSSKIFLFSKNPIEFPLFYFFLANLFLILIYFLFFSLSLFSPISILILLP